MQGSGPRTAPPPPPPGGTHGPKPLTSRIDEFWTRVTDGLEVSELWGQFKADAQTSYRLYSREFPAAEPAPGFRPARGGRRFFELARAFFWAVLMKLSPARRVLLLVALVLLVFPGRFQIGDTAISVGSLRFYSALVLLLLLVLEIADRVTMKRDLEIAREIQLWLVPATPPKVPGLEVAFVNRPANTVAGDYYDVFPRAAHDAGQNDYLLAVADVAGKSLPAALLMATFQASLRTLSASPCSLVELVGGLNRYACAHSREGLRFTTAFLAEFAPGSGKIEYINAGHNAPVVVRASGQIERLEAGGLPLGIRNDAPYQAGTTLLGAGDLLVIFTDGLIEAVNDRDEEFGEGRLLSTLMAMRGAPADTVIRRVMAEVETFVGMTHQHDDITCLVARKT